LNERSSTGLSPRRVQYVHAVLRAALNRAMKWQLVHRNVAKLAEPPRGTPAEIHPLDADQATAFLNAAIGHRYEHLYTFMLASGLRLGEALASRWEDIDLKA